MTRPSGQGDLRRADLAPLWDRPELQSALAERDVAEIYQVVQRHGVSQRQIAKLTGQVQSEISEIINGRKVQSIQVLSRIADGLALPRKCFGLAEQSPPDSAPGDATTAIESRPTNDPAPAMDHVSNADLAFGPDEPYGCHSHDRGPLPRPFAPLIVVDRDMICASPAYWTGIEVRVLRYARRMSGREFAKHLGVTDRIVAKWEAGGTNAHPRSVNQAALDTSLRRATAEERARFIGILTQTADGSPLSPSDYHPAIVNAGAVKLSATSLPTRPGFQSRRNRNSDEGS